MPPPTHAPPTVHSYPIAAFTPPRLDHWPAAVRSAEIISGSLLRCGPGVRPCGWPETPRVRLASLAHLLEKDRTAIGRTAAWVWGARHDHGPTIDVALAPGHRAVTGDMSALRLREISLQTEDRTLLGDYAVTTPLRTLFDLLHQPQSFTTVDVVCCRLLSMRIPQGVDTLRQLLQARQHAYRVRARDRVSAIWGDDAGYAPLTR